MYLEDDRGADEHGGPCPDDGPADFDTDGIAGVRMDERRRGGGGMTAKPPLGGFACRDGRDSLVLGERRDGSIAHISEVASGRSCGCVCPGCGAALIARRGRVNDHHFAHEGTADGSPCRTGPETALHKLAKEILGRRLRLTLPELSLEEDGERWVRYRGGVHAFDAAVLEQRLGGIVPDVIVRRGDRDLLIEFAVTHVCGPEKTARIRELDVSAIEIDLSKLPRDTSRPELEAAILDEAPRVWIHNPLLAEGRAELERRRRAREAAARRTAAKVAAAYAAACAELAEVRPSVPEFGILTQEGFGGTLGVPVRGYGCFRVPPGDWQATLLTGIFEAHRLQGTITFRVDRALGRLRRAGWLRSEFARLADAEIAATKAEDARFGSPAEAVEAWASALSLVGILMPWNPGWQLRGGAIVKADAARRRRLRPIERMGRLEPLVRGIVSGLPETERAGFSFERWADELLPGRDHTPRQALQLEDARFDALLDGIAGWTVGFVHGRRPPADRFGLPLDGVVAREAEKRAREAEELRLASAAQRERDAERRLARLLPELREILGFQADAWAETGNAALDGRTPAEAARGRRRLPGCNRGRPGTGAASGSAGACGLGSRGGAASAPDRSPQDPGRRRHARGLPQVRPPGARRNVPDRVLRLARPRQAMPGCDAAGEEAASDLRDLTAPERCAGPRATIRGTRPPAARR